MDDTIYRKDVISKIGHYKLANGKELEAITKDNLLSVPSVYERDNETKTNFEIITQNAFNLELFCKALVADALNANGCSKRLTMPNKDFHTCIDWVEWFSLPAKDDTVECTMCNIEWYEKSDRGLLW